MTSRHQPSTSTARNTEWLDVCQVHSARFCEMVAQELGSLVNLAVKIRPNKHPRPPARRHKDLSTLFVEKLCSGPEARLAEFSGILDFLTTAALDDDIDRAVRFVAFCIKTLLTSHDPNEMQLGEESVVTILERVKCTVKTTRCRACRLLSAILQELNGSLDIDEGLLDSIQATLRNRLEDADAQVRVEALAALECFTTGKMEACSEELHAVLLTHARCDKNAKVRAAALSVVKIDGASIEVIVERTRDVSLYVQAVSYNILCSKVNPESLTDEQRLNVVEDGINHPSEPVFKMASKMIQSWYADWAGSNPVDFLALFDIPSQESCLQKLVGHLLANYITQSDLESALETGCCFSNEKVLDEAWMFFFRVACCWIQTKWLKGSETSDIEEVEGIALLKDLQDKYLPSAEELLSSIRTHMDANALFQCRQLIEVAACCVNMSDAAHQRMVELVLKDLFTFDGDKIWFEKVVLLAKATWTVSDKYLLNCLVDSLHHGEGMSFTLPMCSRLSEVLRVVPRGLKVPHGLEQIVDRAVEYLPDLVCSDEAPLGLATAALEALSLLQAVFGLHNSTIKSQLSALKSEEEDLKLMALQGLADAAMTYGVVKVDRCMPSQSEGLIGLLLQLLNLGLPADDEESDNEDCSKIETLSVKTLCQLVYTNQSWKKHQFNRRIEANCIARLVMIYSDSHSSTTREVEQIIDTFLEKFASKSTESQQVLQLAFLPVIYMCQELDDVRSTTKAINLMSSLLSYMVPCNGASARVSKGHATLACMLLREYVRKTEGNAEQKLLAALCKAVSTLDLQASSTHEARIFASLVEHWAGLGHLEGFKSEDVKLAIGDLISSVDPLSDEELDHVLSELEAHASRVMEKSANISFDVGLILPELPTVTESVDG